MGPGPRPGAPRGERRRQPREKRVRRERQLKERQHVLPDTRLKIAVFIDFDNIEIGVKNTLSTTFDIGVVLEALKERGEVVSKIAYGDWTRAGDYSRSLTQHATKLVQRNLTPGGDKNGADINLALDALEMAFTHGHINAYVIVGGDSDFITLVEKLKQYDKQVFVVGGRSFTSMVMQRNCHEFIAYENLVGGSRRQRDGGRQGGSAPSQQAPIDQVVPLVRRALKVLVDREVSPQLGLLKSTLLQLDSTFSERTYGAGSFRDFAQKLANAGHVTLREAGRNVLVELADGHVAGAPEEKSERSEKAPRHPHHRAPREESPASQPAAETSAPAETPVGPLRMGEAIREVRRIFQAAPNPPRFPMYLRQAKQFMRNIDPTFDERQYGFANLGDLVRACQKEGLFRIERDRQGGIRLFPGNILQPATAGTDVDDDSRGNVAEPVAGDPREPEWAPRVDEAAEVVDGAVVRETEAAQVVDGETAPAEEPAPAKKPTRRGSRTRTAKTDAVKAEGEQVEGAKPQGRARKTADGGAAKTRKTAAAKPRAPRARKTPAA
jgi:uncharacterized LabA/DUF88 family protein